jgi:phasin family protein
MYATPEQFAAASKAGVENFFAAATSGFSTMERLMELNVATTKAMMSDAAENTRAVFEVKDAKELLALNASLAQPAVEKAVSYGRHVYGIVAETQLALRKAAEEQAASAQKEFAGLIDKSLKNAPAGSEAAVAAVKSAVTAATSAYDNASKIVKQSIDMFETNLANAAAAASSNVAATVKAASKTTKK